MQGTAFGDRDWPDRHHPVGRAFLCLLGLLFLKVSLAAVEVAPQTGPWKYTLCRDTNFANKGTAANECKHWDQGRRVILSGNASACVDKKTPRPWPNESQILIAADRYGVSGTPYFEQHWLQPGDTPRPTSGGCWAYRTHYRLGVERINHAYVKGNGASGLVARRSRSVGCPSFARQSGSTCILRSIPRQDKTLGCPVSGVGNPCDAATGNKFQSETDIQGPVFNLTRHYNSRLNQDVGLGVGWTSAYHKRLEINRELLIVRRGSGRGEPWTKSNSGVWSGDADTRLRLLEDEGGFTLIRPTGATERYDLEGRLLSETTPAGQVTAYSYDTEGHLTTVTGPFGHTLGFDYADGRVAAVTDPAGRTLSYAYAGDKLAGVTYADGAARIYHYEGTGNYLTGITDENGDRFSTFTYGDDGKAISTEHAITSNPTPQGQYSLNFDSSTQTTVTDPVGEEWAYTFDPHLGVKRLTGKVSQTDGLGIAQTFDDRNNLTSVTDEAGRVTTYTYNQDNQKLSMTEAAGTPEARTTTYTYLSGDIDLVVRASRPSVYTGSAYETVTTYDDRLNVTSITRQGYDPAGHAVSRTTSFQYNAFGQVTRIDSPRTDVEDVTTLDYHDCTTGAECGQLKSVTNALGHTTTYDRYDAHGRITQTTEANGLVTQYAYDLRGRLIAVTQTPIQGRMRTTAYRYDGAGQLVGTRHPTGLTLTTTYDAAHQLRDITDSLGNRVQYAYDPKGNRTLEETRDPDGTLVRTVATAYDRRDRVETLNAAGSITRLIHHAVGNLVRSTDPNQNPSTEHHYDPLDRLQQTLDALGHATDYGYDVNDRLVRVRAPNDAETTYLVDDLGNRLQEHSPDRGTLTFTHDAAGNVLSSTDARGVTATFQYDALNRLTHIQYPSPGENVSIDYDGCPLGLGRPCSRSDGSGQYTVAYDGYGNLTQETYTTGTQTFTTLFHYDRGHRLVWVTYPSGRWVYTARDPLGRVHWLMSPGVALGQMTYRADGRLTARRFGWATRETRAYDRQGRLIQQALGNTDPILYHYDANGNVLERGPSSDPKSYGYDALDRLIEDDHATQITYGPNHNRLTETQGTNTRTYAYPPSSNRLIGINGTTRETDAAGNLIDDGRGKTFEYNDTGRLFRVFEHGKLIATYTYNAQGQRKRKTLADGTVTHYHYDLDGHLIEETQAHQTVSYLWQDGEPVAQITGGNDGSQTVVYLHTDHLGTPRFGTDATGQVVWRWDGQAFGGTYPEEDPDGNGELTTVNLRFPGQLYDSETGYHYNWNRYYDPKTGRYITSDPIGLEGGANTFVYARGNPIVHADETGLDTAGCDLGPFKRFETPCRLECCAEHDQCFANYRCTARSWWDPSSLCGLCNAKAIGCFLDCQDNPNHDDPNRPNYFCAKTREFIEIPSCDYPDVPTAERKCRT